MKKSYRWRRFCNPHNSTTFSGKHASSFYLCIHQSVENLQTVCWQERSLDWTKWIQQGLHTKCLIWSVQAILSSRLMVFTWYLIPTPWTSFSFVKQESISFLSHRVYIEHVNSQVVGGYIECLKHLLQRHLFVSRLEETKVIMDQNISTSTLQTGTSPSVFSVFLMNLKRCFWFMQEAAWMWVST